MNLKRFTARTSRDALAPVRQAFGDDAVVMSTRPCAEGVEVLAMAPESVLQLERVSASAEPARPVVPRLEAKPEYRPEVRPEPRPEPRSESRLAARAEARGEARREPTLEPQAEDSSVAEDVAALQMSTLSFQDYVRQRMLKRREAQLAAEASAEPARALPPVVAPIEAARARHAAAQREATPAREVPVLREEVRVPELHHVATQTATAIGAASQPNPAANATAAAQILAAHNDQIEMMSELRSMRGLIEQRFGALAFMEKLQRHPRQAQLSQKLLDAGFSPALIRKLVESLPVDLDEMSWAAGVLERNLPTAERESALEDVGGTYALIGATGVGKTTSTAKLAAAFATKHGAANLGLITLDAYRVAAHEQLRTYGRILGVPVHTAHDRASLEDLLDLLSGKRLVLIDTAGMAQRDSRTGELLEMISHRSVSRLLVVNASAQGETIEDQLAAYGAGGCRGVVLSKLDEAVKLGPALDAMIRHKLKVLAIANGQRVPEDWHRLSANALVQRALKVSGGPAWRMDEGDMNLVFAGLPASALTRAASAAATV